MLTSSGPRMDAVTGGSWIHCISREVRHRMVSTCDENSIITQSRSAAVVVVTALLDDGAPARRFDGPCVRRLSTHPSEGRRGVARVSGRRHRPSSPASPHERVSSSSIVISTVALARMLRHHLTTGDLRCSLPGEWSPAGHIGTPRASLSTSSADQADADRPQKPTAQLRES